MGEENRGYRRLILGVATCGGIGYLPCMPGTWATLAALPLWYGLSKLSPWSYGLAVAGLLLLGLGAAGPAQKHLGQEDAPAIVIDEVVGLLITLAGVPPSWPNAIAGFLVFRTLDVAKPYPIRWFGTGPGGLEVMADDVAAGVMGRIVLEAIIMVVFRGGG